MNRAVAALLKAGADPNAGELQAPLHIVESPAIAKLLLAAGARVDHVSALGESPLHAAASRDHVEILTLLLDHAPEHLDLVAPGGHTPLGAAAGSRQAWRHLVKRGADPAHAGPKALHLAAASGNTKLVELLLAHGYSANRRDSAGRTPLMRAQSQAVRRRLLTAGADPYLCAYDGKFVEWKRAPAPAVRRPVLSADEEARLPASDDAEAQREVFRSRWTGARRERAQALIVEHLGPGTLRDEREHRGALSWSSQHGRRRAIDMLPLATALAREDLAIHVPEETRDWCAAHAIEGVVLDVTPGASCVEPVISWGTKGARHGVSTMDVVRWLTWAERRATLQLTRIGAQSLAASIRDLAIPRRELAEAIVDLCPDFGRDEDAVERVEQGVRSGSFFLFWR